MYHLFSRESFEYGSHSVLQQPLKPNNNIIRPHISSSQGLQQSSPNQLVCNKVRLTSWSSRMSRFYINVQFRKHHQKLPQSPLTTFAWSPSRPKFSIARTQSRPLRMGHRCRFFMKSGARPCDLRSRNCDTQSLQEHLATSV